MMLAILEIDRESGLHRLRMQGHANYRAGGDIVCAGASALACALHGYLARAEGHVTRLVSERMEAGDVRLACYGDASVTAAYEMAQIGLMQLAARYPENVSVKISAKP